MTRSSLRHPFHIPSRALTPNLYGYTTKKKRTFRARTRSLDWAEPILNRPNKEQAVNDAGEVETPLPPPHMLHVVYLIKDTNGRPWWEKQIVKKLHLEGKV